MRPAPRWPALLFASLGGIVAALSWVFVASAGSLRALVRTASRLPAGDFILFGLIAGVTIYNAIIIGLLLWEKRDILMSCPPCYSRCLAGAFFVVEQLGVGGNLPLYDRYVSSNRRRSWVLSALRLFRS